MALARIEVLEGRDPADKRQLVEAVRAALSTALEAPTEDPVVRLVEYPEGEFTVPYPDRHTDRYALVEVTMFAGRSMATKRRLYDELIGRLSKIGMRPLDVLIVLQEQPMENWGVEGGKPASEVDVGFKIDV